MRTIKFRGLTEDGRWEYGTLVLALDGKIANIVNRQGGNLMHTTDVFPQTVGMFTGLKDKYGLEIYEGDIFTSKKYGFNSICVVKFGEFPDGEDSKSTYIGFYFEEAGELFPFGKDIDGTSENYVVLGNIHQNKDLLDEE